LAALITVSFHIVSSREPGGSADRRLGALSEVESHTIVAAAVRADLDQPSQAALQFGKLGDLRGDSGELRLRHLGDVVGRPGWC
jgi:hypothetical protein